MATKAVVTGGAGFIGSHLAASLLAKGWEVAIVDDLATGRKENLAVAPDAAFHELDINETDALATVFAGAQYVFHVAAIPAVPRSIEDPQGTNHANIDGTLSVLVAAKKAGVQRVVFSSSSSVYGDSPVLPKQEDMPTSPISPYATQKLAGEQYMRHFSALLGLETVVIRYFNVFGPRQDPKSTYAAVIPLFITLIRDGKPPLINGDGTTTRDFTYVDNVVHGNILAATTPAAAGKLFNIACGAAYSLNDLVAVINRKLGTDIKPEYGAFRAGDVKDSLADITRAKEILGYEPLVTFEEGIERTIAAL